MDITDDAARGEDVRRAGRWLARLFAPHWRAVALVMALAVLAACAPIFTVAINRAVVDGFAEPGAVLRLTGAWVLVLIAEAALAGASAWITFRVGRAIVARLANAVFERLAHQSPRYHQRYGVAEAHTLLSRCLQEVGTSFTNALPWVVASLTLGIGAMAGMASVNPRWTLVAAPLLVLAGLNAWWLGRRQAGVVTRLVAVEQRRIEITGQVFDEDRLRVVKRNGLEDRFVQEFAEATREHERVIHQRGVGITLYTQMHNMPALGLPIAWLAGYLSGASASEVVACAALLTQVLIAGTRCSLWCIQLADSWPYAQRALSVLEEPLDADGVDPSIQAADLAGQPLILEGLRCTLGNREVLRGVDLVVRGGSHVAIVGPNGAGKTTLLRIVTGILRYDGDGDGDGAGARIGTIPICRIPRKVLAGHIRAIDSKPVTFTGTARESITFLHRDASQEEIAWACAIAQIAYPLDREARSLSDGEQIQMLVAQVVLTRPAVLLLDEGLKHLHPTARANLREALRRELPWTAIVEVIHEGAVTSRAISSIVVIEAGVVAERGTHEDLMRLKGRYARYVADGER